MDFISKDSIFLDKHFGTKEELFDFLSNISKELNISNDPNDVKNGLYDREKAGNTVISNMIAMPHTRVSSINKLHVLLIRLQSPIEYNKGEMVDLVYSILAPLKANDEFIDVLTSIATVVQDDDLQNVIRKSNIGDEENIILKIDNILQNM